VCKDPERTGDVDIATEINAFLRTGNV